MIKSLVDAYSVYLQRAGKRNKADVTTDAVESRSLKPWLTLKPKRY